MLFEIAKLDYTAMAVYGGGESVPYDEEALFLVFRKLCEGADRHGA